MLRSAWLVVASLAVGACGSTPASSGTLDGSTDGVSGDGSSNPPACPDTEPTPPTGTGGVSCAPNGLSCSYGCTGCNCQMGQWYCSAPGCSGTRPCPITAPPEGTSCATNGACCGGIQESPCTYASDGGGVTALCNGSVWHVTASASEGGMDGAQDAGIDE